LPTRQVYSLPGLALAADTPLSSCCGWPFGPDRPSPSHYAHVAAATRHGHVALLGPQRELIRLALAAGTEAPSPPAQVYDWELAAAAAAAAAADRARAAAAAAAAAAGGRTTTEPPSAGTTPRSEAAEGSSGGAGGGRHSRVGAGALLKAALRDAISPRAPLEPAGSDSEAEAAAAGRAAPYGAGGHGEAAPRAAGKDLKGLMAKISHDFQKAGGQVAAGFQKALDETRALQKVALKVGVGGVGGVGSALQTLFAQGQGRCAVASHGVAFDQLRAC
jgi:hypothetical protein